MNCYDQPQTVHFHGGNNSMNEPATGVFLALCAHEMRTPLNVISLASHLLQPGFDNQTVADARNMIDTQVSLLSQLITDLAGMITEVKSENIKIEDVIDKALMTILSTEEGQKFKISTLGYGGTIFADPIRVQQILINLLTNAMKYSTPGSLIQLNWQLREDAVEISIKDQGKGISHDMLERIFDPFVQDKRDQDRGQGGFGLGLALVKSLVVAMGGLVIASSDGKGCGSTFTVILPKGT